MATIQLTEENFESTILCAEGEEKTVLVDFWAEWCRPCKMFGPIFEAASDEHGDLIFGKVDTEAQGGLASAFAIRSIPTLMVFRDGIAIFQQAGALPADALADLIRQVKALDMNEVRRQIAEHRAKQDAEA
ncbi:MAG: thioredoxin [Pseudomonadota bacterium]